MNINEAMKICFDNKVKVYPVISIENKKKVTQIEFSLGLDKTQRYKKTLKESKEISLAMKKTYIYLAEKIKRKESLL